MRQPRLIDRFPDPEPTYRRDRPPLAPPEPKRVWYERLRDVWRNISDDELTRRFAVGNMLNEEIAHPDDKQPPGADRLLKEVAKMLSQTLADLNRMRRLPTRFENAAALRAEYPDAVTWDDVKKLFRPAARKGAARSARATRRRRGRWRGTAADAPAAASLDSAQAGVDTAVKVRRAPARSVSKTSYPPGKAVRVNSAR
jgi:hypothetical protein